MECAASRVPRIRSYGDGAPPCWVWPSTTSRASKIPWLSCSNSRDRNSLVYMGLAFSFITVRKSFCPTRKLSTIRSTSPASWWRVMPSSCR